MSIDLAVYSISGESADPTLVKQRMWELGWEIMFLSDWFDMTVAPEGQLNEYAIVVGWKIDSELSTAIALMFEAKDRKGFEKLAESMHIASCELWVGPREDEEEIDFTNIDESHSGYLRNSKTIYSLRTAAGRSRFSFRFQEALWRAIGGITSGLLIDYQTGEYRFSNETPKLKQETERRHGRAPWFVISLFGLMSLAGLLLAASGKNPFLAKNWYVMLSLLHGPLAFGLYKRSQAAWKTSLILTAAMVFVGIFAVIAAGFAPGKMWIFSIHAYGLYQLLSADIRAYFAHE